MVRACCLHGAMLHFCAACMARPDIYLPTFSELYTLYLNPGDFRDFKVDMNTVEDPRRLLKISKDVQSLPKRTKAETAWLSISQSQSHDLVSQYLNKEVSSFTHSFHISYIGFSLHIFGNCVKQSCNHSHLSIRRENLAETRAWADMRSKVSICLMVQVYCIAK